MIINVNSKNSILAFYKEVINLEITSEIQNKILKRHTFEIRNPI